MKSYSVLILGCNGFIGTHLVNYFLMQSYVVSGCDLKLPSNDGFKYHQLSKDGLGLHEIFQSESFDYCINAAGNGNINLSILNPEDDFNANVQFTLLVLECIRIYSPECKFIQISSAAVYGNPEKIPVVEQDRLNPISPYGWHKLFSEMLCKEYFELYHLKSVILRPFSVYGPGLKKQLLWDVFTKVKENESHIELWGTGEETRDFLYIDDLVRSIWMIIQHAPMHAEVYNIGYGQMTKISHAVQLLLKFLDKKNEVNYNGITRIGNPNKWQSDISKIKSIGFFPEVNLEKGLLSLANWLKSQQ